MGEPTLWMRILDWVDWVLHVWLCALGKHYPPTNLDGELERWCWYCYKEVR